MLEPRTTDRLTHTTAIITLASALCLNACQSNTAKQEARRCNPSPGMTTEQLALCGCFPMKSSGDYEVGISDPDQRRSTQEVRILNYFCPSKTGGFIKVITLNGVARDVFR